jgi:hypothetical protein
MVTDRQIGPTLWRRFFSRSLRALSISLLVGSEIRGKKQRFVVKPATKQIPRFAALARHDKFVIDVRDFSRAKLSHNSNLFWRDGLTFPSIF